MRWIVAALLLSVAALCQSIVGEHLPLVGGRPDWSLVCVLAWAVLRGSTEGAIVGFMAGLWLDSVAYTQFGVNTALLGILGYAVGIPQANAYRGNIPFFVLAACLATLAYHALEFLLLQALGQAMPPLTAVYGPALWAMLLNALLVLPVFALCQKTFRSLEGWKRLEL